MATSINVWELLTSAARSRHEDICRPKVLEDDLSALGRTARFGGQELNLVTSDEGWIIEIFSCYCDGDCPAYDAKIRILIPKDGKEPVRILEDRIGRIQYHHH